MTMFSKIGYVLDMEGVTGSIPVAPTTTGTLQRHDLTRSLGSETGSAGTPIFGTERRTAEQLGTSARAQSVRNVPVPFTTPCASTITALFVATDGTYANLPGVDPWDQARDARTYKGPWPVLAHPPCQRWGRYWHGAPRKPHQYQLGADDGCFAAALAAVRRWGGVLEHPADSHAWAHFGLNRPDRVGGWVTADFEGGWTCHVEQGHYGHFSRKPTWLYAVGTDLPDLIWGAGPQRLHPVALERYGYAKARRIGMAAMIGGKRKTEIREATPEPFRDVLLSIAHSVLPSSTGGGR